MSAKGQSGQQLYKLPCLSTNVFVSSEQIRERVQDQQCCGVFGEVCVKCGQHRRWHKHSICSGHCQQGAASGNGKHGKPVSIARPVSVVEARPTCC